MKKNICQWGWLIVFIVVSKVWAGPTYVTNTNITANTTWTASGSPYVVQNTIFISKGAVLTIDPGVQVRFATTNSGQASGETTPNTDLSIEGGLRAIGTATDPISFYPLTPGQLWGAIYFSNSDPANSILQDCIVKGGKIVCNASSPVIQDCDIFGAQSGIEVAYNADPQVINNRIAANDTGILLLSDTSEIMATHNQIYGNNYGIYIEGIFSQYAINQNEIYSNLKYNVVNTSPVSIDISNNDFKLSNASKIAATIYDQSVNPKVGPINFEPYIGVGTGQNSSMVVSTKSAKNNPKQEPHLSYQQELWNYGKPFNAMEIGKMENGKKSSTTVKILAIGATAVLTVGFLFL